MSCSKTAYLVISQFAPSTKADHAGAQFLAAYLERLTLHHDVSVLVPQTLENKCEIAGISDSVSFMWISPQKINIFRHLVWRLFSVITGCTLPPWFLALTCGIHTQLQLKKFEVIELYGPGTIPLTFLMRWQYPRAVVSCLLLDIWTTWLERCIQYASSRIRRLTARLLWFRARAVIPMMLRRAHLTIVFTSEDVERLRSYGVKSAIYRVMPAVVCRLPLRAECTSDKPIVAFVGAFWREENCNAIEWLLSEIWPKIRLAMPDCRLLVVGSSPPKWLTAWDGREGIVVTGYVEDLLAVYQQALCLLVPLRIGSGIKHRVLEAVLVGLPVVGTSVAAEGICEIAPNAFGAIADDALVFSREVVKILCAPKTANTRVLRGRDELLAIDFGKSVDNIAEAHCVALQDNKERCIRKSSAWGNKCTKS